MQQLKTYGYVMVSVVTLLTVAMGVAQERKSKSATTTICMSTFDMSEADLKAALLAAAKQAALKELLGNVRVVPQETIAKQASTLIKIHGSPQYYPGKDLGEACIRLQASLTADGLAQFHLTAITGNEICIAQAIASSHQHAATMAKLDALYQYEPALLRIPSSRLVPLLRRAQLSGGAKGASTCFTATGEVYPPEIEAVLAESKLPLTSTVPSEPLMAFKNGAGMTFVLIPAGAFVMGAADHADERPVHRVRITQPYYLGMHEVTLEQWKTVMGHHRNFFHKRSGLPVDNVSWRQVQKFIQRLNEKEGGPKYRLPTEAEWEYGARAASTTAYSFGDDASLLAKYAWYTTNSGGKTQPVGRLLPNAWGLYDMHGNVWEWVQDWYGPYPDDTVVNPAGSASGKERIYRGGSWYSAASLCRSAQRVHAPPKTRDEGFLGFRLVRDIQ